MFGGGGYNNAQPKITFRIILFWQPALSGKGQSAILNSGFGRGDGRSFQLRKLLVSYTFLIPKLNFDIQKIAAAAAGF